MAITIIRNIVLSLIIFSCQNKQSDSEETRNQNIDTVMIDTGSEVLFLGDDFEYLSLSGLSSDGSKLYIFDPEGVQLSIVNMANLKNRPNISITI